MKALISPNETFTYEWISSWERNNQDILVPVYSQIENCQRVAEVKAIPFEVASPLHWVDCPEDCTADDWYYKDNQVHKKPQSVPIVSTPIEVLP